MKKAKHLEQPIKSRFDAQEESFEELIKYCEPHPDAQEELLNCPFVYEYEDTPKSSPSVAVTPSEPTGILMLSVPSTDTDGKNSPAANEVFETPPEHIKPSQLYFSGSDDPKPSTAGVNRGNTEVIDLGSDSDDLGFPNQQNNNGGTEAVNRDNMEVIDLGSDSDDVGFPNRREVNVQDTGKSEEQLQKRYKVSEEDFDVKNSVQRVVKKEPIVIKTNQTQTQEVDMEAIEGGIERNADSFTVKMSERHKEEEDGGEMRDHGERGDGTKDGVGVRGAASMNLDKNEKLNGVGVNGGGAGRDKGKRKLPLWTKGGSLEEVGRREPTKGTFEDLVEDFSMIFGAVSGDDSDDKIGVDDSNDKIGGDFLETAMRRGLTFPRPRWWPPEGFTD
ncbi:hypothetical protein EJD97_005557 [Solanum chilense]|uniref:Uncharacterized protein n=1 Tax=Solanum chilense TaxID=4083 RepID=A0A6N2BS78_SOLCI|nr:hypothetical protein EJD97_005557 [Solanum chilense]